MASHGASRRQSGQPARDLKSGRGVHVTDIDGHETIDAVGGLWNVNLGYSCEPIKQAMADQLADLPYANIFRGVSNDKVIQLAHEVVDFFAADGAVRAFFTSGGSDSVETALRLARQYHKVNGESSRTKFISLKKGIMARILVVPALTGMPISGRSMNRFSLAVFTFLRPIPIATHSTKQTAALAKACAAVKMKSRFKAPA